MTATRKPHEDSRPTHSRSSLRHLPTPRTRRELRVWVSLVFGLDVPDTAVMPGSTPPLDYLCHSFFERPGDAVVWANRGGGKTMLGGVATLLDLIHKPGIQVRVLGGSMEQSRKMHEHMVALLDRAVGGQRLRDELLASPVTRTRIALRNGSAVELLAQSQRSVRGTRVHKLRCDEVDEFDPDIWAAAQMVTRSGRCGGWEVPGTVEAISTMHRPFGLMSKLVCDEGAGAPHVHAELHSATHENLSAEAPHAHGGLAPSMPRVFRWSALDVIERCPPDRPCHGCVLWDDCAGRAKTAEGFIPVDDLVSQFHRTDRATWDAEMLCRRPTVSDCVYPGFDPAAHVRAGVAPADASRWLAGMDFGVRSPTVWLWAIVEQADADAASTHVHIVDEHHRAGGTLDAHLDAIDTRACGRSMFTGPRPVG